MIWIVLVKRCPELHWNWLKLKIRKFKDEKEDDDSENDEQMLPTTLTHISSVLQSHQIMTNISKKKYHMFQDLVTEQSMK